MICLCTDHSHGPARPPSSSGSVRPAIRRSGIYFLLSESCFRRQLGARREIGLGSTARAICECRIEGLPESLLLCSQLVREHLIFPTAGHSAWLVSAEWTFRQWFNKFSQLPTHLAASLTVRGHKWTATGRREAGRQTGGRRLETGDWGLGTGDWRQWAAHKGRPIRSHDEQLLNATAATSRSTSEAIM